MTSAARIAGMTLQDADGEDVRVGELWAERPVALVFLRHFGCIFCREHTAELSSHRAEIEAAGGHLAAIGMGTPAHAAQFREMSEIEFPLLVCEDTSAHEAIGLERGSWMKVAGPAVIPRGIGAMLKGHRTKRTAADMQQLGGTFVIDTDGEILWSHKAKKSSENSTPEQIIAALGRAKTAA